MSSGFQLVTSTSVLFEREAHWDRKLRSRFSLAPRDLVREGGITKEKYERENAILGSFSSYHVVKELRRLRYEVAPNKLHYANVAILGIGLTRDWGFVSSANELGMEVKAFDVSTVACRNGDRFFRWLSKRPCPFPAVQNYVEHAEAGKSDLGDLVDFQNTFLIYAGQFIQILSTAPKDRVMSDMGRFLKLPHRRIIFVHPFPNDNSGVEWGDTTPYSMDEIVNPLEASLSAKVEVKFFQHCRYFHHVYAAVRLKEKK